MLFLLQGCRWVRSFPLSKPLSRHSVARRSILSSTSAADELLSNQIEVSIADAIACHRDNVAFLDGTWWLGEPDKGRKAFEAGPRIAGAHFYDIDDVASKTPELNPKGLPHMMPPPALQATFMDAVGITNQHHIIVYGQADCPFLHRAWYQCVAMGHGVKKTHLLAGSLQDWIDAGGPIDTKPQAALALDDLPQSKSPTYRAVAPTGGVVSMDEMRKIIDEQDPNTQIVDARSAERFLALVDEPRPGLRRGHMPGASNIFFKDVLQAESLVQLRDPDTLRKLAAAAGLNPDKRIVASCGSGATGCTLLAALYKAGYDHQKLALFDGSWMEWGADQNVPVVDEQKQKSK